MSGYDKNEAIAKAVGRAVRLLSEHADTVQVFTTHHDEHGTHTYQEGSGNHYARRGQVVDWLRQNANPIQVVETEPDDD